MIDYFSAQTEPTILVMFGDHQPSVEQEFLDKAYGVTQDEMTMAQYMDKFKVPFIIWANYPLTGDSTKITSLNFLLSMCCATQALKPVPTANTCGICRKPFRR